MREQKMHKLEVSCGKAWSLRSAAIWFSYQVPNLFGNRPKSCILVLTILGVFISYNVYQTYFSLALNDSSLEDYYAKFKGICEEINLYQPISSDVRTMKK